MCLQDFPGSERALPIDTMSLRGGLNSRECGIVSTVVEQHCEISLRVFVEVPPTLHAPLGSYPGMLSGGCTQTLYSLKRYPFSTSANPYHVPVSWYGVNLSLSPRSTGSSGYCLTLGCFLVVGGEWRNSFR